MNKKNERICMSSLKNTQTKPLAITGSISAISRNIIKISNKKKFCFLSFAKHILSFDEYSCLLKIQIIVIYKCRE